MDKFALIFIALLVILALAVALTVMGVFFFTVGVEVVQEPGVVGAQQPVVQEDSPPPPVGAEAETTTRTP